MTRDEVNNVLEHHPGQSFRLSFDNTKAEIRVVSADPDGMLCRPVTALEDPSMDFWVSYSHIQSIEPIQQA